MERWLFIIICAASLLLIAGIVAAVLVIRSHKNNKKAKKINMISTTELGTCHLHGTTKEFDISFAGTSISFLVRDGVIVGHRDKSSSPYVMYPMEKSRKEAVKEN